MCISALFFEMKFGSCCMFRKKQNICDSHTQLNQKNNSGTEPVKIRDAVTPGWISICSCKRRLSQWFDGWVVFFHVSSVASLPGNAPCIDSKKRQHDPPIFFNWWKGWLHPKRHWTCPGGCVKGTSNFELRFFGYQLLQRIGQVPMKWDHLRCFTPSTETGLEEHCPQFSGCFIKFPMTRYNTPCKGCKGSKSSDKNRIGPAHANQCFG